MAVGARDNIDRELVRKYAKLKMDNPETTKLIDTQTMLNTMQEVANLKRDMAIMDSKIKEKLNEMCMTVTSKTAKYTRINFNPPRRR